MYTLLLKFSAPLQSWGNESKFNTRRTWEEPSKSGVTGLLAAALGRQREDDISDINRLRLGTRTDAPGKIIKDFHVFAPTEKPNKQNTISERYYLCDATFLVGLEWENSKDLENIIKALKSPIYTLYLGRRSCPANYDLVLGIRENDLETTLWTEPWIASSRKKEILCRKNNCLIPEMKLVIETKQGEIRDGTRNDVAISFDPNFRQYGFRGIKVLYKPEVSRTEKKIIEHDPIAEL